MKKTIKIVVLGLLCLNFWANAQRNPVTTAPLKISDTIPKAIFNRPLQVISQFKSKKTITLSDYKGKLIILDFWASWCGSCIKKIPELIELQKTFGDKIKIISCTSESAAVVESFLSRPQNKNLAKLPMVYGDKLLHELFPHNLLPHEIWLSPKGIYLASTSGQDVNSASISRFLDLGIKPTETKSDLIAFDPNLPLRSYMGGEENPPIYQSTLTSYLPGVGTRNGIRSEKESKRLFFFNCTILRLYEFAVGMPLKDNKILEVVDPKRFQYPDGRNPGYSKENNLYCYELIFPIDTTAKEMREIMLEELNKYFGLNGRIEHKPMESGKPVFILTQLPDGYFKRNKS